MASIAPEPRLASAGLGASIDCESLYALPGALGADATLMPQAGWSDSLGGGERWLALGAIDERIVPAGAGLAAALEALERARENLESLFGRGADARYARYLGGLAFDPRNAANPGWPCGEAARFVLPRVLLRQASGRTEVTVLGTPEREARRIVARLAQAARQARLDASRIHLEERAVPRERERWIEAVRSVLGRIESGAARKVVLSRDLVLEAREAIDPWRLMHLIHEGDPHGFRFCLRFADDSAFVGASPERLVRVHGSALACDCLAGTIRRGSTKEEEARQAARLLASEKDGREHRIVREEILAAIAPHLRSHEFPAEPGIMALPGVLHLWTPIRGRLRDAARLSDLVGALHPTPAVGGSPREVAMDEIRALEGRSRGWYAGLVGWVGIDEADFAVAIRSAIVRGRRMTAFGGAGIVRGSDPAAEWEETARKAASFISLFAERS